MAEETDQDAEARLQLEEYQRQQAAQAVAESQGQPNAIPSEGEQQPSRAIDYTERGLPAPNIVQGEPLSPQEQQFWAANPNGAIVHPETGELIGLGQHPEAAAQFGPTYERFGAGIGAPGAPAVAPQEQIPNFVQIPQSNPDLAAQHEAVGNRIAQLQNQLRSASPVRPGRFQQSPKESIAQELNTLQRAYNGLSATRQQEQTAITAATNRNATAQKQWLTQRDTNGAQRDLIKLLATTEPGSNERRDGLFQIHNSYEHADQKTQNDLIHEASKNSERATAMAHALAQGYTPTSTGFGPMGESMKFAPKVPDKYQTRYDKLQAAIQGHSEALAAQRAEETRNKSPTLPYKGLPNLHTQQREAASLEKRFPGLATPTQQGQPSPAATPASTAAASPATGFIPGQRYRDANGNEAIHNADGTWLPVTK